MVHAVVRLRAVLAGSVHHGSLAFAMSSQPLVLAVDLGGTKLAAGIVDDAPTLRGKAVRPTVTSDAAACLADLFACIDGLLAETQVAVQAIGVGTASMVDYARGYIVESTNLPLRDIPLRDQLQDRYGLPAAIDNDATVACIAEHRFGVARGVNDMLMLTIGTGIGGGIIARGVPYRGYSGAAAEFGHMVIDVHGPRCQGSCPNSGCLEAFVSGRALVAAARRLAAERPDSAFAAAAASGESLDGPLVTRLAQAGDGDALAVYDELGTLLGVGMTGLVNAFNPEMIVVGGAVAAAGDLLLEPARRVIAARALRPQRDQVRVVRAAFAEDAGLIGAAALAFTELLTSL